MSKRTAACLAALLLAFPTLTAPASAENQMGYQLLSAQDAAQLPRRGGALGMDIGPAQRITDGGMTFELLRVNGVRRRSPGSQAGFGVGDQIIAANGHVFPSVAAFAAYIGSMQQGGRVEVDYIPSGGGPQQAQRVAVTLGAGGRAAPASPGDEPAGMSTGKKVAIGIGAAALFGCYELGCFSRSKAPVVTPR